MEYLVEQLKPMLKNPNAVVFNGDVLYLFTNDCVLMSIKATA